MLRLGLLIAAVFATSLAAVALSAPTAATAPKSGAAPAPIEFRIGADISSLPRVEAGGGIFKDRGKPGDLLDILKCHGVDHARLRLWKDPKDGICGLDETLAVARRLKSAGMPWLLDLHYSDDWADPGHQIKPAAWAKLHGAPLESAVFDYTRGVIDAFDRQGTPPEIAEIGNEVTNGLLWPDGKLGGPAVESAQRWDRFARLLQAGIRGVTEGRAGKTPIRVMIHIDPGGNNGVCRWFFDALRVRHVGFDLIGLSYYPWWHGSLEKLKANLDDLGPRYGKDLIVVETGWPSAPAGVDPHWRLGEPFPPTPSGQRDFLAALVKVVRSTPGGRCKGIYYWEPAWIPTPRYKSLWKDRGLFDDDGELLDSIDALAGK